MTSTSPAVAASPADYVPLARHNVAGTNIVHSRADVHDLTAELVAYHERRVNRGSRPVVPRLDVQVRAADTRARDTDENLALTRHRLRYLGENKTWLGGGFE